MSFEADLKKFGIRSLKKFEVIRKVSAFQLFSSVVLATPVRTGLLRGNWFVSIDSPSREQTKQTDSSGSKTLQKIEQDLNKLTRLESDIYLTNNLPYGPRIEYEGYSAQAPEGMVRINLLRWNTIVKSNIARFGK